MSEGAGETAQTLLLIKPKQAGAQSNWVIVTDERTYFVDFFVNPEPDYQSAIAWNYPVDGLRVLGEQGERQRLQFEKGSDINVFDSQAGFPNAGDATRSAAPDVRREPLTFNAATPDAGGVVGPLGMNLGSLNFGYVVLYQERGRDGKTKDATPPAWAPLRVFDDGSKTFLQFPPAARNLELPPVFGLDHPDSDRPQLVNYRRSGDYLVIDGLIAAAEMRAGEAPQQVVKIGFGRRRRWARGSARWGSRWVRCGRCWLRRRRPARSVRSKSESSSALLLGWTGGVSTRLTWARVRRC